MICDSHYIDLLLFLPNLQRAKYETTAKNCLAHHHAPKTWKPPWISTMLFTQAGRLVKSHTDPPSMSISDTFRYPAFKQFGTCRSEVQCCTAAGVLDHCWSKQKHGSQEWVSRQNDPPAHPIKTTELCDCSIGRTANSKTWHVCPSWPFCGQSTA